MSIELSIIIPARQEMWLAKTVENVLANTSDVTEIIVVADGDWPEPGLPQHPRVKVFHVPASIGQRAATNRGVALSSARYVMKLDAHCAIAPGFDLTLITTDEQLGRPDVTQIPRMYNLYAFDWRCKVCGERSYQGPTPTQPCWQHRWQRTRHGKGALPAIPEGACAAFDFERAVVWTAKASPETDCMLFDYALHFQYWGGGKGLPHNQGPLTASLLSSIGACFFMRRERFHQLGGLDERHGSWGQYGVEIACKSWLSGGEHLINKATWFAHMFRTQGGDFGHPYELHPQQVDAARSYSQQLWMNNLWPSQVRSLAWLLEKFAPVPGWHVPGRADGHEPQEITDARLTALAHVTEAGRSFR